MPKYLVELTDGRKFEVEADQPPTENDLMSYMGKSQAPAAPKQDEGYLSQLGSALSLGGRQMASGVKATFNAATGDVPDTAAAMAQMGALQQEQQANMSSEDLALNQAFEQNKAEYDAAKGLFPTVGALGGYVGSIVSHPGAAFKQAVQSAPNAAISAGTGLAGYALGGLLGAGAGIETGPGAILTGIAGAGAGGAVSNTLMEAGPAIYDILNERTNGEASTMTADQISQFLRQNPDIMSEGLKTGAIRGSVIGVIEGLGMKGAGRIMSVPERAAARAAQKQLISAGVDVASKEAVDKALLDPALKSAVANAAKTAKDQFTTPGNLARLGGASALEVGSSGAGELAAQTAAGQETDMTAAVQEMMGEVALSAPTAAVSKGIEASKYFVPQVQEAISTAEASVQEAAAAGVPVSETAKAYQEMLAMMQRGEQDPTEAPSDVESRLAAIQSGPSAFYQQLQRGITPQAAFTGQETPSDVESRLAAIQNEQPIATAPVGGLIPETSSATVGNLEAGSGDSAVLGLGDDGGTISQEAQPEEVGQASPQGLAGASALIPDEEAALATQAPRITELARQDAAIASGAEKGADLGFEKVGNPKIKRLAEDLAFSGVGSIDGVRYAIQASPDGTFYVQKTTDGVREALALGQPDIETANQAALKIASNEYQEASTVGAKEESATQPAKPKPAKGGKQAKASTGGMSVEESKAYLARPGQILGFDEPSFLDSQRQKGKIKPAKPLTPTTETPTNATEGQPMSGDSGSVGERLNAAKSREEAREILNGVKNLLALKDLAKEMGYPTTGTKKDVVNRLVAAVGSRFDAAAIRDSGKVEEKATFRYEMRARPPSIGTHPKEGFVSHEEGGTRHGFLTYDRPLTEKEIYDYELKPVSVESNQPTSVESAKPAKSGGADKSISGEQNQRSERLASTSESDNRANGDVAEKPKKGDLVTVALGGREYPKTRIINVTNTPEGVRYQVDVFGPKFVAESSIVAIEKPVIKTAPKVAATPQLIRQIGDIAVKNKKPLDQGYIDSVGGNIPQGYVKQGDLYVFQPEKQAPSEKVEAGKPADKTKRDNTQPAQMTPEEYAGRVAGEKFVQSVAPGKEDAWWNAKESQGAPNRFAAGTKMASQENGKFFVLDLGTNKYKGFSSKREAMLFFKSKDGAAQRAYIETLNQGKAGTFRSISHRIAIDKALAENQPVSSVAVDAYKVKLPQGYEKRGDLYVSGVSEQPQVSQPAPTQESKQAPETAVNQKPEQPASQKLIDMAKQFGGRIAWADGDMGIIEAFQRFGSKSLYVAIVGNRYSTSDFTFLTPSNRKELLGENEELFLRKREGLIKDNEQKLADYPNGPFANGQTLVASKEVPEKVVSVFKEWAKMLGLNAPTRIVLTTFDGGVKMASSYGGKFRRIGAVSLLVKGDRGQFMPLGENDFHISYKDDISFARILEAIAHELGHVLQRQAFDKLPQDQRQAIMLEHEEWLKKVGSQKAIDGIKAMRSMRLGKVHPGTDIERFDELTAYWKSFSEWFADQVARWSTTTAKPLSIVERFFARLGKKLREFFFSNKHRFAPNEKVSDWLNSLSPDFQTVEIDLPSEGVVAANDGASKQPETGYGEKLNSARKLIRDAGPKSAKAQNEALTVLMTMPVNDLQDAFNVLTGDTTKLANKRQLANNILNEIIEQAKSERSSSAEEIFGQSERELEKEQERQDALAESRQAAIAETVKSIAGNEGGLTWNAVSVNDGLEALAMLHNSGETPGLLNSFVGTSKEFGEQFKNSDNKEHQALAQMALNGVNLAEGYFLDSDGKSVLFTDKTAIKPIDRRIAEFRGIPPAVAASIRVLTHEGLGHRGWWGLSEKDRSTLVSMVKAIKSPADFDRLATQYPLFEDWATNPDSESRLAQEFISQIVESLRVLPKKGPVRRLLEYLQEVWQKYFGKKEGTLSMKELRLFVEMLQAGSKAPKSDLVNGGKVDIKESRPVYANPLDAQLASAAERMRQMREKMGVREVETSLDDVKRIVNASLSRAEVETLIKELNTDEVKDVVRSIGYPTTGTKADNIKRILSFVGSRADAIAIRGENPTIRNTPTIVRTPEQKAAFDEERRLENERAKELDINIPKKKPTYDQEEWNRNMAAIMAPSSVPPSQIRNEIRNAYDAAIQGQGSVQAPLQQVYDIAKAAIPTLTEKQFGEQVQALYEDSSAFLVPTDRSADMLAAGEKWGVYDVAGLPASYLGVMPSQETTKVYATPIDRNAIETEIEKSSKAPITKDLLEGFILRTVGMYGQPSRVRMARLNMDAPLQVNPQPNGELVIGLGTRQAGEIIRNSRSPQAGFKYLADAIEEEMIHFADLLAMRTKWEAQGSNGSFTDFIRRQAMDLSMDLMQVADTLSASDKETFRKALAASLSSYRNDALWNDATLEDILQAYAETPMAANAELVRSLIQAKRSGEITATGYQRIANTLVKWLKDALNWLQQAYGQARNGGFGNVLAQRIQDTEKQLEMLGVMPTEIKASKAQKDVDTALHSARGITGKVDKIVNGLPANSYTGKPLQDAMSQSFAPLGSQQFYDETKALIVAAIDDMVKRGIDAGDILATVIQPDFTEEAMKGWNDSAKSVAKSIYFNHGLLLAVQKQEQLMNDGDITAANKQQDKIDAWSKFWFNLTNNFGVTGNAIQRAMEDPAYQGLYLLTNFAAQTQKAQKEVTDSNVANPNEVAKDINEVGAKSKTDADTDVADALTGIQVEDEIAAGEAALTPENRTLWERAKAILRSLARIAKAETFFATKGIKASNAAKSADEEVARYIQMGPKGVGALKIKLQKEFGGIVAKLTGTEKTGTARKPRTPKEEAVHPLIARLIARTAAKLNAGTNLDAALADLMPEMPSYRDRIVDDVVSGIVGRANRSIKKPKAPGVLADLTKQLKKILSENIKVEPKTLSEESLGKKALRAFGYVESNEKIIEDAWKKARNKVQETLQEENKDATPEEIQTLLNSLMSEAPKQLYSSSQARTIIRESLEGGKFDNSKEILDDVNGAREAVLKSIEDAVKQEKLANPDQFQHDPSYEKSYILNAFDALVADLQKARDEGIAASNKVVRDAVFGADGQKALKIIIRKLTAARPGIDTPLAPALAWKRLFEMTQTDQGLLKGRMFDIVKDEPAFADLDNADKQKLADILEKSWDARRQQILTNELERLRIKHRNRLTKKAAKVFDNRPAILKKIDSGVFDYDDLAVLVGAEFGIKPLTAAENKRAKEISARLSDDIPPYERTKLQNELQEMMVSKNLSLGEMLKAWWISAVLTGPRTAFTIGWSFLSGGYELMGHAATVLLNPKMSMAEKGAAIGDSIKNWWSSIAPEMRSAYMYVLTGDKTLQDPAALMQSAFFDNQFRKEMGRFSFSVAEKMITSKNPLIRYAGWFMTYGSRILNALDAFNFNITKAGSAPLVYSMLNNSYKAGSFQTSKLFKEARKKIVANEYGGIEPADTSRLNSWARNAAYQELSKITALAENMNQVSRQSNFTLEPTGFGGWLYSGLKFADSFVQKKSEAFVTRMKQDLLQGGGSKFDKAIVGIAELIQAGAMQTLPILGLQFAKFALNKLNQTISFIPVAGFMRLKESGVEGQRVHEAMIYRNQAVGAFLFSWVYLTLKAIEDEPDDEKRGWGIEGGWSNLTPQEKRQRDAAGLKEHTIWWRGKDGKRTVANFMNWPISPILAAAGAMSDQIKYSPEQWAQGGVLKRGVTMGWAMGKSVSETSALSQFTELFGSSIASRDPVEAFANKAARVFGGYAGGYIPRIFKDIDRNMQPEIRKYEGWEYLGKELPYYRRYIGKEYLDIFGNVIAPSQTPWSREFVHQPDKPEYTLLSRLNSHGVWLTPAVSENRLVGKGTHKREMTDEEANRYVKLVGKSYSDLVTRYTDRIIAMPKERARQFVLDKADEIRDKAAKQAIRKPIAQ